MEPFRSTYVPQEIERLATQVIDAAFVIHQELGPGLLEGTYEACLAHELSLRGISYSRQMEIPLKYRGYNIPVAYRADLLVESKLLVELKATDATTPLHKAQVITYLKLLGLPLGLLVNFNERFIKNGIERVVKIPRQGEGKDSKGR